MTVIIVHYETPVLLARAIGSLPRDIPLIIVENSLVAPQPYPMENSTIVIPPHQMFHGDGLHFGIQHVKTPYFVCMDSDAYIKDPGIFDIMMNLFVENMYGIGMIFDVDKRGENTWVKGAKAPFTPYLHPYFCMIDTHMYHKCEPFVHHGAPALYAMQDVQQKKFLLHHIDLKDYVHHDGKGTRSITDKYKDGWDVRT